MMKDGFLYRTSLRIVPPLFVLLTKIWFASCHVISHDEQYVNQYKNKGEPVVAAAFHYAILFLLYFMRKETGVAMVSASKDGEYIARVVEILNFKAVRGSQTRGGMRAIRSLIRHMREGRNAAIVADGSKGPPLVVQAGCIVLASRSQAPVVPMLWSCNRYKRFASWDGTVLPYPFSRIDFFYGEPLVVPPKIKSDEIEYYRIILEKRLNELYTRAWQKHGRTIH